MSDKFNASEHMEKVEEAKDETLEKIKSAYKKLGLLPSEESSGESKSAETGFDEGASRELIEELKRLEELYRYEKAGKAWGFRKSNTSPRRTKKSPRPREASCAPSTKNSKTPPKKNILKPNPSWKKNSKKTA